MAKGIRILIYDGDLDWVETTLEKSLREYHCGFGEMKEIVCAIVDKAETASWFNEKGEFNGKGINTCESTKILQS